MRSSALGSAISRGCSLSDADENDVRKVVKKILSELGWPISRIAEEVGVQGGRGTVFADFVVGEGNTKFVIETKGPSYFINDDHSIGQLLAYLRLLNIKYGFLYNGSQLLLLEKDSDKPLFEWECGGDQEVFSLFSKDSFPTKIQDFVRRRYEDNMLKILISEREDMIKDRVSNLISRELNVPLEVVKRNILLSIGTRAGTPSNSEAIEVQSINRSALESLTDGDMVICPSDGSGIDWLKKYNVWRSVNIKRSPKYFALYVGWPESQVLYFGEVESVKDVDDSSLLREYSMPPPDAQDLGKKAIILKEGSLKKLSDPIGIIGRKGVRGPRYTSLSHFIGANTVDDLTNDD